MWVRKERREALLVEYKLAQQMHNYYGKIVWQIGAILLGGGITGFGFAISQQLSDLPTLVPWLFWGILIAMIVGFLLIAWRCRALSYIYLLRCMEIEDELGLKQQIYAEEAGRRSVLIRGKCRRLPPISGWPVLVSLCLSFIILSGLLLYLLLENVWFSAHVEL